MDRRRRVRAEAELGRGKPTRRVRKFILVVCEGEKTERVYLESLRSALEISKTTVEIVGAGAEIVGVVSEAIDRGEKRRAEAEQSNRLLPYDEVWGVVDTERRNDNPSWEQGVERARAAGLKLAWSNPCFEFWLLLHFEHNGSSFDGCAKVRPLLRKHIPRFKKSVDCFEHLAPHVPKAVENSKTIHRSQWRDTPKLIDRNPGTTVHELVERLMEVAGITIEEYQSRFPSPGVEPKKRGRASRS